MGLGLAIGAITFTGSIVAFGKLQGIVSGQPVTFPLQHPFNAFLGILLLVLIFALVTTNSETAFWGIFIVSLLIGVLIIIPIGGADMPVVVSMLNSYSGWAACGIGFTLGNPLLIITGSLVGASGATLDVNGTIDLTGATKTGFPAGGLTHASQWRLHTDFSNTATPLASNLEEVDAPVGFGVLGASMPESSGVFTFPATGYWWLRATHVIKGNTSLYDNQMEIQTTTDNSSYSTESRTRAETQATNSYQTASCDWIFDVTDTANCKCQFQVDINNSSTSLNGATTYNQTFVTFTRLGDT